MDNSFKNRCNQLKKIFENLAPQDRYTAIMQMGRELPLFPQKKKTEENQVPGCQSTLYIDAEMRDGKVIFYADGDALISKGLAAILIFLYSGLEAETILKNPPKVIEELSLIATLSLNRSNGFANLLLKMQQISLNLLIKS